MTGAAATPYCGTPPVPAELWRSWNLDPVLLAALALCSVAYGAWAQSACLPRGRRVAFAAGLFVVAVATVSPLCRLGVALFSARVAQHLLLAIVAAPLLARGGLRVPAPAAGSLVFAACLWIWHLPGPYDATLASPALYWTAHLSLLASASWLWSGLLGVRPAERAGAMVLALATAAQMGLLGALLTFAPAPRFASHLTTTAPWGFTPLEDQQLGGLLCWIPACLGVTLLALAALAAGLRELDPLARRTTARQPARPLLQP